MTSYREVSYSRGRQYPPTIQADPDVEYTEESWDTVERLRQHDLTRLDHKLASAFREPCPPDVWAVQDPIDVARSCGLNYARVICGDRVSRRIVVPVWWALKDGVCACHLGADCPTPGDHRINIDLSDYEDAVDFAVTNPWAQAGVVCGEQAVVVRGDRSDFSAVCDDLARNVRAFRGVRHLVPTAVDRHHGYLFFRHPWNRRLRSSIATGKVEILSGGELVEAPHQRRLWSEDTGCWPSISVTTEHRPFYVTGAVLRDLPELHRHTLAYLLFGPQDFLDDDAGSLAWEGIIEAKLRDVFDYEMGGGHVVAGA